MGSTLSMTDAMTMRENAAKVADDKAAMHEDNAKGWRAETHGGEIHARAHYACAQTAHAIAARIRALPDVPNPTRAALEECVRAVAPFEKLATAILGRQHDAPDDGWVVIANCDGGIIDTSNHITIKDLKCIRAMAIAARTILQEQAITET